MRGGRQIQDRSLVWNTDLIETLELQNCLDNAMITMCVARSSCPRRSFR
jgi:succinate dehydrogenase / fumarate reductase, flavoprotein subunit